MYDKHNSYTIPSARACADVICKCPLRANRSLSSLSLSLAVGRASQAFLVSPSISPLPPFLHAARHGIDGIPTVAFVLLLLFDTLCKCASRMHNIFPAFFMDADFQRIESLPAKWSKNSSDDLNNHLLIRFSPFPWQIPIQRVRAAAVGDDSADDAVRGAQVHVPRPGEGGRQVPEVVLIITIFHYCH